MNPVWPLANEPVCFQRFQLGRCQPHLLAVAPLSEASVVRERLVFGKLRGEHSLLLPKRLPLPQKRRMVIVTCVGWRLPPAASLVANPIASQAARSIDARINACSRIGDPRHFQGLCVRLGPKQGSTAVRSASSGRHYIGVQLTGGVEGERGRDSAGRAGGGAESCCVHHERDHADVDCCTTTCATITIESNLTATRS